jgi:hypothetical protein
MRKYSGSEDKLSRVHDKLTLVHPRKPLVLPTYVCMWAYLVLWWFHKFDSYSVFKSLSITDHSRDSAVGTETGYRLDNKGWCTGRVKNFAPWTSSTPALEPTQPPIKCVPGVLSEGGERQGRDADHLPPTSAEFKKMWIYVRVLKSFWLFLFLIFLFAAQPKEFFLGGLKKLEQWSLSLWSLRGNM